MTFSETFDSSGLLDARGEYYQRLYVTVEMDEHEVEDVSVASANGSPINFITLPMSDQHKINAWINGLREEIRSHMDAMAEMHAEDYPRDNE